MLESRGGCPAANPKGKYWQLHLEIAKKSAVTLSTKRPIPPKFAICLPRKQM